MHPIVQAWPLAALLVASPWATAARESEAIGSTSDPLKVAPGKSSPDQCRQGYVWREARPGDRVCVVPATRTLVAQQNRGARALWIKGAYGPRTCMQGYVWREAFKGDDVCVSPQQREQARRDNQMASQRRIGG